MDPDFGNAHEAIAYFFASISAWRITAVVAFGIGIG
jgi:hypothetical protein